MTAAAGTSERAARGLRERPRRGELHTARGVGHGRATLEERIGAIWTELVETGMAECPVCAAELVAGRPCTGCGSELS